MANYIIISIRNLVICNPTPSKSSAMFRNVSDRVELSCHLAACHVIPDPNRSWLCCREEEDQNINLRFSSVEENPKRFFHEN
ncbi:hypothetical protein JTE90_025506 [Oedothorax gibbosus]|uniref:Uncharacterized protein n=1 Tax=Oedothorax gibbosus TaxID=931172 RepID=A0AAV6TKN9_9ARAC|nr:hypothetical protein JTE90_025506 [Oedothorax gibbosus]